MESPSFSQELFGYLNDLAANNERPWFQANKPRYVDHVQEPALEFINALAPKLAKISPHFQADSRVAGGSLFRIQRDTRFSKDKTPYKTNTGMHFRHDVGKDAHAPGFYLHLQPGECFAGAGLWRPEPKVAAVIRQAIADDPAGWNKAAHGKVHAGGWTPMGDSLIRPPKGIDADHPLIEDLKRKNFVLSRRLTEAEVTAPHFIDDFASMCSQVSPYMRFLCQALGVAF
ncbi:MAG: DUF2461 domain-containing protein [Acidimicrobiia bacterium]